LPAQAQNTTAAWKALEDAAKREAEARKRPDEDRAGNRETQMFLSRLQAAMSATQPHQVDQALNELSGYATTPQMQEAVANVRLAIKKDRDAAENSYASQVAAALNQAEEAVKTAKTPQEIDAPMKALSAFRNQQGNDRRSEETRMLLNKVSPTLNFLQRWQDYLAAKAAGSENRARDSLRNLLNNENVEFIPRSQILLELQKYPTDEDRNEPTKTEEIDAIVAKMTTLDDIPQAIQQLRQLVGRNRYGYGGGEPLGATISALNTLERNYREYQAGLPARLETPVQMPDFASPAIVPLRVQLLVLALPRYFGGGPDVAFKPRETVQDYLTRLTNEAQQRGDATLLTKVRHAQRAISGSSYAGEGYSAEQTAMNSYVAGQNQEKAGQFMLAVISYESALRAGSDAIPAKQIGDRLAALQREHPQDYEAGLRQFNAQRSSFPYGGFDYNPPAILQIPGAPSPASPSPAAPLVNPNSPGAALPTPTLTPKK